MRYKRFKRRGSKVVKMKFQSFVDLSTEADTMKIISVNAGGLDVVKRLAPFFTAYKYYRLGAVSVKLIPASTLPVSPSGLSYEVDEPTVDPRDQLTPGMCRITNGEDILENITGLTGDQQRELYNNMLLDPRWYKWMMQTGVKRYAAPRFWQIGQLHQDKWPGYVDNYPYFNDTYQTLEGTAIKETLYAHTSGQGISATQHGRLEVGSSRYGLFQTGQKGKLGWMPTDGLQDFDYDGTDYSIPLIASPPEVELFKILMPPVRKTNYYYRMFITETVYFKEPVVFNINGYRPIDVFRYQIFPSPAIPTSSQTESEELIIHKTGGNDGSDKDL